MVKRMQRAPWVLVVLSLACVAMVLPLIAQAAKPAPKFIGPTEAIKLYWNDALNQFKSVRSTKPKDSNPDDYELIVVPKGAVVWVDDFYDPLVRVRQGREDLRNGLPQVKLYLTAARVPSQAAAQALFREWKAVVLALPGAQLLGDQYPFSIGVATKPRLNRRTMHLNLSDEPEDGAYIISLEVSFNEDEVDGGGG